MATARAAAAAGGAGGAAPQVAVITTLGCPYCRKAKAALEGASIPFSEYELSEDLDLLARVKAATGQATVPQIFVGGRLLGGASDVVPLVENGELAKLLAATTAAPLPAELQQALTAGKASGGAAAAAQAAAGGGGASPELRSLAADLRSARLGGGSGGLGFTLQAACTWLAGSKGLAGPAAAEALGRLQAAQLLTVVAPPVGGGGAQRPITPALAESSPQLLLRLVADAPAPRVWSDPLNGGYEWYGPARPAAQVAESLRAALLRLYDAHLGEGGGSVDYAGLRADTGFGDFVAAAAELQAVDLSGLASREERMAFFINTYNALIVHAMAVFGPAADSLSRLRWFGDVSYLIGGARWSSNDVEHGALRGNAPSPASLFALLGKPQWAGKTFKGGDPRAALAIQPVDPRIHFALNCGAASCPPIRIYTPERLEFGLEEAARAFCASEVKVDKAAGAVEASMILKWYGGDFGDRQALLEFVAAHLPEGPAADLREMLQQRGPDGIALTFRPYDWSVNAKK